MYVPCSAAIHYDRSQDQGGQDERKAKRLGRPYAHKEEGCAQNDPPYDETDHLGDAQTLERLGAQKGHGDNQADDG
jgi:hypothetical protein